MDFKLILIPETPDKYVIREETPLSGLKFIQIASACLRRNLDLESRARHNTLGTVSQYEISVPQALAIESGKYEESNIAYLNMKEDDLKYFIFYGASMSKTGCQNRSRYPYYQNEVVVTSYIDELLFLEAWKAKGFPTGIPEGGGGGVISTDIPIVPSSSVVPHPKSGQMILDKEGRARAAAANSATIGQLFMNDILSNID